MIIGVGIDTIRVSRIRKSMERTPGFETGVFTEDEIRYCRSKAHPNQHLAGRFAAKEAFMKAMGTGWSGGIRFQDIFVGNLDNGQPFLDIRPPTADLIPDLYKYKIHVSISHDGDYATAMVIIESVD